ncbi:MAG: glycine--tRNA ligase subunit beta, partial [Acidocella sp.]|nr:glycine--tRNA ligase subunit beta [Acidocella sp.]
MAEFFLELFSEEIPARMQRDAGAQLESLVVAFLQNFRAPGDKKRVFYGPRRIAVSVDVHETALSDQNANPTEPARQRGPRLDAPPQALEGFLRKNNAVSDPLIRDRLVEENGYYYLLDKSASAPEPLAEIIQSKLAGVLAKFSWPKSMRWGQSEAFMWVRPLRRMICMLDGAVIPIDLGPVTADDKTEGHRVHAPGAFTVSGMAAWEEKLTQHYVIANPILRREMIAQGLADKAAGLGLRLVADEALLDEITGLVEWPVPMIGRIDDEFMALPPEVRELSMKVNQKYLALRDDTGKPAPYFAFVANLEALDGGVSIIEGNQRVLRARLSDAQYFWARDRETPLDDALPKLETI